MSFLAGSMQHITDEEIETRLEQLAFTIALDTTHFHAFGEHDRHKIRKDLQVNKQALRTLRHERDRRIISGIYHPRKHNNTS